MASIYIIQGFHWGYNDEVYYPCGRYIKSTFDNKEDAEKAQLALEREHWQHIDLGETTEFFDSDQTLVDKVNAFVTEKCGKPLFIDDAYRDIYIPKDLTDDDFKQFLTVAGLGAYQLTKFETDQTFYALWMPNNQGYLKIYDEYSEALIYESSIDLLKTEAAETLEYHWDDEEINLTGKLSELSNSPVILQTLIEKSQALTYNPDKKMLTIHTENVNDLFAINELLKTPLFEIKSLNVEEIQALEAEMNDIEY